MLEVTMKKVFFLSMILLITLSGCTLENAQNMVGILEEHTVFKTVLEIETSHEDNVALLEKRFDILGIELVEKAGDQYTVLSHFPITNATIDTLQSNKVAYILGKNDEEVLSADDFRGLECLATSLNLTLAPSTTNLDIWGEYVWTIDNARYKVWLSTESVDGNAVLSCILDDPNIAVLHDFAIAISRDNAEIDVDIVFVEESIQVTDKMKK